MRPTLLVLGLAAGLFGCRATAPVVAEPEHVGQLVESYASIRPPAPVAKRAPVVEAVMVGKDDAAPASIEGEKQEEAAPELVQKRGLVMGGVR